MKRFDLVLAVALSLGFSSVGSAAAQFGAGSATIGDDIWSTVLHFGAVSPATELPDGSTFELGAALGASTTWWFHRNLGVTAYAHTAITDGVQGEVFSAAAANVHRVFLYGADLRLRYPIAGNVLAPYISGGPAGKSYKWNYGLYGGASSFAWSAAGGVDFRPIGSGRIGMVLESRYHRSGYHWHGLSVPTRIPDFDRDSPSFSDVTVTAGLSVNF